MGWGGGGGADRRPSIYMVWQISISIPGHLSIQYAVDIDLSDLEVDEGARIIMDELNDWLYHSFG